MCGNVFHMDRQNVTIKDIALKTGVSKSTVSRVLCNDVHVSPETREKVLSCAKALDFEPNFFAKALKTQKSKTIAFFVPNIEIMIYPAIIQAMEAETLKRGYTILLCDIQENKEIAKEYIRKLKSGNVDGFIFSTALFDVDENEEIREAKETGLPCLNLLRSDASDLPSVCLNNKKGSEIAVDYFVARGMRRIAYLQGQEELKLYRDRYTGYLEALKKNGLPFDEKLVWHGFDNGKFIVSRELTKVFNEGVSFDAVLCASDNLAVETIHILNQLDIKIPEDVSIIGYDNVPISELLVPRLTAIAQPFKEMGRKAVNVLVDMIEGKIDKKEVHYTFDPTLIERDTVKSMKD